MSRLPEPFYGYRPLIDKFLLVLFCGLHVATARAQLPELIDLAQEPAGVEITGAVSGDYSGYSLASGDFNGDEHADLAVLSVGAAPLGGSRRGIVDLIWGPFADGTFLSLANPPGTRIFGTLVPLDFGSHLSAGDLNADGFDDLIWSQPLDGWGDGKVSVVLGRPAFPDTIDMATGPGGVITVLGRYLWSAYFGVSTCACDMNGDGYDDLVASSDFGEVVVILGSDSLRSLYDIEQSYAELSHVFEVVNLVETGRALACGDLDGDSREDLVLGHESAQSGLERGLVRVLFGHDVWSDTLYVSDPAFHAVTMLSPLGASFELSVGVARPEAEVFVSDANADPLGGFDCGEVYRTFPVSGLPDSMVINSHDVARSILIGQGSSTHYGLDLTAGDLDADGWTDLAVASRDPAGNTVIVYGNASVPDSAFLGTDTTTTRILERDPGSWLGYGIEIVDFNGDGVHDLALGAHRAAMNKGQTYIIFGVPETTGVTSAKPMALTLWQNYPNPFNPVTTIVFTLPSAGHVRLDVFDVGGRFVQRLVDGWRSRDRHEVRWDGRDRDGRPLASGVYFYRLTAPEGSITRKAVLLR